MCLELRQLILTGVCSLVALLGEPAFATPHGVTLESVMSAPMPANLVAAPQGGRIAWMVEVRGRRNVWVAEPRAEGHSARQLTHYVDDDGLDLGELTWDARGETILYTRGSTLDFGSQRTNPLSNPTSSPQGGAPWELWAVSVKPGAAPHKLAEGRMASVSPKGNLVAYLREDHIWVLSLDGTVKPHQLIHDQGDSGGHAFSKPPPLVWSPDGARLAFVSQRGDHNFIGVYDVAQRSVTWMVPSVDMDSKASWSADGRRIAFIRIPSGSGLFAEAPGTWSIWVADAASGAGHAVWHADSGPGGAFTELDAMKAESPLFWTADDYIVFPWEKTGWTQLYALPASGSLARLLTPGQFEVFAATLSRDRQRVTYSSNQGDSERRHLWQVGVAGGAPVQLTSGTSTEDMPVISSHGRTAAIQGGGVTPLQASVVTTDGSMRPLAPAALPVEYPASQLAAPQLVTFQSTDGLTLHGQLFLPPASNPPRAPAVLHFHGGPANQRLLTWNFGDTYNYANCLYLATQGYLVLSVNYRGSTGYGLEFREPAHFSAMGGSELNDIRAAALYLRGRSDVDAKRIGIWGHSYGGLMAAMGLANLSDLIAAGVDHAGVHDWRTVLVQVGFIERGDPRADAMFAASPIAAIKNWRSPVLVIQSDDDRNVPFSQFAELIRALRQQGVDYEQLVIPNEIHEPLLHRSWLKVHRATDEFFARRLGLGSDAQPGASQ